MLKLYKSLLFVVLLATFQVNVATSQNGTQGSWGPVMPSSVIPVSAANLTNGKILVWAADTKTNFGGGGRTYTSVFDPSNNSFTEMLVTNTAHQMFCPGIANLPDGKILVTGGGSSEKASIYDPVTNTFSISGDMNTPRGYHSMVTLSDGRVFTLGGSWSGGLGNKNAEIWSPVGSWTPYPGITADSTVRQGTSDPQGVYREDNHAWLWAAPNGKVFHAGPGSTMHWLDLNGTGSVQNAGPRGDDHYAMNGNTVMYDIGKILKLGGSNSYSSSTASSNSSYIIDINGSTAQVTHVGNLNETRTLHSSVVLPNGEVVVIGGLATADVFSDVNARLGAEIWTPATQTWRLAAKMSVPRTYHSVALLMQDGRIFTGGGGLCGTCSANHPNAQIFTPPYLYNRAGALAVRPVIHAAPTSATYNSTIKIVTDETIVNFSLVRLSSVTHSVNNEQRRIPLKFTPLKNNNYTLNIPNANLLPPGSYFLFAMNQDGVPSVGSIIRIENNSTGFSQLITNGTYFINSVASINQRIVSPTGTNTSDAAVRMAPKADNNEQKWEFAHLGNNIYTIKNIGSNRYMEVTNGVCQNDAAIGTNAINLGTNYQRWLAIQQGDDYFFRPVHCQGLALDRNNQDNLGPVLYTFSTGNNNQKFILTPTTISFDTSKCYTMTARHSGKVIEVPNNSTDLGTQLQQQTYQVGSKNQLWKIKNLGDGSYRIDNVNSGKSIDVYESLLTNGTPIIQYDYAGHNNQKWIFSKNTEGYYNIQAKHSGRFMNVYGGYTTDSAKIIQWETSPDQNQQFSVSAVGCPTGVFALKSFTNELLVTPKVGRSVELHWIMNQQHDIATFTIQHATEGNEEFVYVKTFSPIKKMGIQYYDNTTDVAETGVNFYRIKIEFVDSSVDYSDFRPVFFGETQGAVSIFPNPTADELFLDLSNYMGEKINYLIGNISGNILLDGIFSEGHSKQERIRLDNLPPGMYMIYTKPEKHRETAKEFFISKN